MSGNESKQKAELIWSKLFSISGEGKTKEEQLSIIESVIINVAQEQRKVGNRQILNHFKIEIDNLCG